MSSNRNWYPVAQAAFKGVAAGNLAVVAVLAPRFAIRLSEGVLVAGVTRQTGFARLTRRDLEEDPDETRRVGFLGVLRPRLLPSATLSGRQVAIPLLLFLVVMPLLANTSARASVSSSAYWRSSRNSMVLDAPAAATTRDTTLSRPDARPS